MPFSCGRRISCHDVLRKFANQVAIEVRHSTTAESFDDAGVGNGIADHGISKSSA